jgi:hypothetical protein
VSVSSIHRSISLIALLALASPGLQANVCFTPPIQNVIARSDAIIVGRISSIEPSGDDSGRFSIDVSRVIRGQVALGPLSISYSETATPIDGQGPGLLDRLALLFVATDAPSADLRLVHLQYCSPGGDSVRSHLLFYRSGRFPAELSPSDSDNAMQRLIKELAILGASKYLQGLAQSSIELPTYRAIYQAMMRSSDRDVFVTGLSGLANLGTLDGLIALDRATAPVSRHRISGGGLFLDLGRAYRDRDPRGIPILARWLEAANPQRQRLAAADALVRLRTVPAITALADTLVDRDDLLHWQALQGLMTLANEGPPDRDSSGEPWPFTTVETRLHELFEPQFYQRDQAPYLEFWRSWWEENRAAIEQYATE